VPHVSECAGYLQRGARQRPRVRTEPRSSAAVRDCIFVTQRCMDRPIPNSYWVKPGRLLAGEHPYDGSETQMRERLERLHAAGINYFIDLTEHDEVSDYRIWLPKHTQYLRSAIADQRVPHGIAQMRNLLMQLRNALALRRRIYVHCLAGIGRTGLVIGCFLAEDGLDGEAALAKLNDLWQQSARAESWPTVPQTEEQADYIRAWPQHRRGAIRSHASKGPD